MVPILIVALAAVMISSSAPVHADLYSQNTSGQGAQGILIYSSIPGGSQYLFVPDNSSGIQAYPDWTITFLQSGSYRIIYNGSTLDSGNAIPGYSLNHAFHSGRISLYILQDGSNYTFSDIYIVGQLSSAVTQYVSVVSSFSGQNQYLSVIPGQQGVLMYGDWNLSMYSSVNASYSVQVNSQIQYQGFILGHKYIHMTFTTSPVSLIVTIGSQTFRFPDEIITTVPLEHYYGPKPLPLVYTIPEYEAGIEKAFAASVFAILISILSVRKYVIEKEKREVQIV
ncbi:MAG: hypothetical protein M1341_05225 [Candidatus Thermoplasmatota archaeon]|nr:hypothetical protein [Candidatus Thermoplasmatota archaeon]